MATPRLGTSQSEGSIGRMTEQRRERLINLKKREDLKGALTEKFKTRFGTGARERGDDEVSVTSSAIRREVDHFAGKADVTEANLGRLERRLQGKAQKNAGNRPMDQVSMYSGASRRSQGLSSNGRGVMGSSGQLGASFDWARLDEYASYLHEQDAIRQKIGVSALQRKLKMDLDHQVQEKANKRNAADEEDRRYHQNSMVELERWKQTEQMRQEELHEKLQREKRDRDEQLAFEQKLKNAELQRKKDEESCLVEKIVNEMESEQKKFERKKEENKKKMYKVFLENQEDQKIRNQQKKEQSEREAAAMVEYNRILDEQEEQRAEELANRMGRQKELMEKLMGNVQEQTKNAGDNDAQRANAQQDEMDRHYFEAEKAKQTRLKQMRSENQAYLIKQMGEKDGRKGDDRQLGDIQAQILQTDTDEYNQIERQKAVDKRIRNFEHRQDLEKQIEHRSGVRAPAMSSEEVSMNRPLLSLVERTLNTRDRAMTSDDGEPH